MITRNKYYSPKFYYDLASAQLHVAYRQVFSIKILIFVLSVVSVTTGYAKPVSMVRQAVRTVQSQIQSASQISNFRFAQERTAEFEGGFQKDATDNGNWTGGRKGRGRLIGTNLGISAPLLASYLGRTPSMQDMKNITEAIANEIYRKLYWSQINGDKIKDAETAAQIYDTAVNMGVKTAIRLTQRSLGLAETGIMDEITLNALNTI